MSWSSRLKGRLGGLGVYGLVRQLMGTLDYQALFYDRTVDPARQDFRGPVLYIFWHEYIPAPFYLRPHCNIAMLLSRHRDAEWLSQAAELMGFDTIRGSTRRGGDAALRELFRRGRSMNLAITPDGPRGPRRTLASGCIFTASKLGLPLVAFGVGYDRPWRLGSWDRFAVPRPYSRVRIVVGPRIRVPADLDRDGIEQQRRQVEAVMNRLTDEAEEWALSGDRRRGQVPLPQQAAAVRRFSEPLADATETLRVVSQDGSSRHSCVAVSAHRHPPAGGSDAVAAGQGNRLGTGCAR
jgi:lysophospholipid acyltransferase (LPLAT)-like uncharacterized protein